jgi:hypothetical protein
MEPESSNAANTVCEVKVGSSSLATYRTKHDSFKPSPIAEAERTVGEAELDHKLEALLVGGSGGLLVRFDHGQDRVEAEHRLDGGDGRVGDASGLLVRLGRHVSSGLVQRH